jgi:hypothetical protein
MQQKLNCALPFRDRLGLCFFRRRGLWVACPPTPLKTKRGVDLAIDLPQKPGLKAGFAITP